MSKSIEKMNYDELRQYRLDLNQKIADLKAEYVTAGKLLQEKAAQLKSKNTGGE